MLQFATAWYNLRQLPGRPASVSTTTDSMAIRNDTMNSPESTDDLVAQLIKLSRKPGCTADEIKAAYLRFAKQLHPDHGGNAERFQRLQRAYETSLARIKHGCHLSTGSKRFVPWPVESGGLGRQHIAGGGFVVVILALIGWHLQPTASVPLASLMAAIAILVLLPIIMASSGARVIALILVIVIPVSLAFVVVLSQSEAATRLSEGRGELGDIVVATLVLPATATLLASIVGLLFWLAGDRN